MPGRAAQQRADPRQHLLQMEGFCDIVVGAGIEALNLVAPAVARGEDQHRHHPLVAPPGLKHRDTVHLGQADIQHDRVIGLAVAKEMSLLTVERAIDHVSGIRQGRGELAVQIRVILNDEQTHVCLRE